MGNSENAIEALMRQGNFSGFSNTAIFMSSDEQKPVDPLQTEVNITKEVVSVLEKPSKNRFNRKLLNYKRLLARLKTEERLLLSQNRHDERMMRLKYEYEIKHVETIGMQIVLPVSFLSLSICVAYGILVVPSLLTGAIALVFACNAYRNRLLMSSPPVIEIPAKGKND